MGIYTQQPFSTKARMPDAERFEPTNSDEERAYKNAYEVLSLIRDGTVDPTKIRKNDRIPVVAYLRLEGHSPDEISRVFDISITTIKNDFREITRDRAKVIKGLDLTEVAGRIHAMGSYLSQKARRDGSYGTSWKIEKEMVESLQSLGFVYQAPKLGIIAPHAEIRRGFDELTRSIGTEKDQVTEALDRMLDSLGGKRKIRIEQPAGD